jgi:multidrug efflux pump subunit AcrB
MGAEAVVEEPKPVPKPVPERPSVSESEKREYRNGYFRRTYTNVRSKSTKAKLAELTSFVLLTCVFIPLVIAVTLYTYMVVVYNQDHQKHVNIDWVQHHVADRLERTYRNNIYEFAVEHLDINNPIVRFLSPLRYEVQAMMRIKTIEQAYIVTTATVIGIWFAAMPVFLLAFYIMWTSFKMGLTYLLPKGSTPVYILDFATLKVCFYVFIINILD